MQKDMKSRKECRKEGRKDDMGGDKWEGIHTVQNLDEKWKRMKRMESKRKVKRPNPIQNEKEWESKMKARTRDIQRSSSQRRGLLVDFSEEATGLLIWVLDDGNQQIEPVPLKTNRKTIVSSKWSP